MMAWRLAGCSPPVTPAYARLLSRQHLSRLPLVETGWPLAEIR
jgi:hypothetical protein